MDYLKDLHETCETLSRELGEANEKIKRAGGKLSAGDLEYIDKLLESKLCYEAMYVKARILYLIGRYQEADALNVEISNLLIPDNGGVGYDTKFLFSNLNKRTIHSFYYPALTIITICPFL